MENLLSGTIDVFRHIVHDINEGLAIVNQKGILTYANGRFCEITGYTKEEILGHAVAECLEPEFLKLFDEHLSIRRDGKSDPYEMWTKRRDGVNIHVRCSQTRCFDSNGNFTGSFGIVMDMTELKQATALLQQAKEDMEKHVRKSTAELMKSNEALNKEIVERNKLSELFSKAFLMSPALMAINRFEDHVFLDVNHRFTRFTGYSREEVVGRSASEVNVLSQEDYENIYQDLNGKGSIYNEEIEYRTKSGNIRVGIYSAELIDVHGEKLVLSIHHDITERRHAQIALKKREEELSQRSAELEEANTALRVLLKRRMEDQKNLEARLQQNINELVIPYIRELENNSLNQRGKSYLNLLESNVKDIASPFLNSISAGYKNLTPTEIQVATMVREGMMSKNIAELLGVAVGTVDTHRNNIRKKLGLKKGKINLRSYLLSIS